MKAYEYKTRMAQLAGDKIVYAPSKALREIYTLPNFLSINLINRRIPDGAIGMIGDYWICVAGDEDV